MSHVTTIDLLIKDLDALEKACAPLGLELRRGQKTFRWYGKWMNDYGAEDAAYKHGIAAKDYGKCDHAIAVKGNNHAYEIGLIKREDGKGYSLAWDFFAGGYGLCEKVSYSGAGAKDADKLKDWYAAEVAAKQMRLQGFAVKSEQKNGKVLVTCTQ